MRALRTLGLFSICASAIALRAQDIHYYKLDDAGGLRTINFAGSSLLAPAEGAIVTTDATPWAPSLFGASALRGSGPTGSGIYSFVETGGHSGLNGSFTVAWFLKQRSALPSGVNYFFGSNSSGSLFRGYSGGGLAGSNLLVRNWGGTPSDLRSASDVYAAAASAWAHIALVVDSAAGTATFYLDGVAEAPLPITGGANVPSVTTFRVNAFTQTAGNSVFDMDDFRLLNRAATAQEVLDWTTRTSAADARYGIGCGATLSSVNGPPSLGNFNYALSLSGAPNALYALAIGSNRLSWASLPLPLDLGLFFTSLAGCGFESSAEVFFSGVLSPSGSAAVPAGVPSVAIYDAAIVYAQAIVLGATPASSNPFAIGIGR